jgi:hypothetical protein
MYGEKEIAMNGSPRILSRDPYGILLQRCRKCKRDKDMNSFHNKHLHLDEPYSRATICKDCMKPIWKVQGSRARAKLRAKGLNWHGKPFAAIKRHPLMVMGKFRREAA